MKEENFKIPNNKAVCFDEDCTCSYVYMTEEQDILLSYCSKREIGSHLWLDIEEPRWASLSPIDVEKRRDSVLQGTALIKKLKLRDFLPEEPLH